MPANPKDLVGAKKAPIRFVPPSLMIAVAPILELGGIKYNDGEPVNWRKYDVKLSIYYEAAMRHMASWYDGEELDPESEKPHTWHAAACLAIIIDATLNGTAIDDRPLPGPAAQLLNRVDRSGGNSFADGMRAEDDYA
jgi:hypothetical protein